jgi:hypothetical protein
VRLKPGFSATLYEVCASPRSVRLKAELEPRRLSLDEGFATVNQGCEQCGVKRLLLGPEVATQYEVCASPRSVRLKAELEPRRLSLDEGFARVNQRCEQAAPRAT